MCLEGYPRSANTFSLNLIRGALIKHFPVFFSTHAERLLVHHTHQIATVKAARHHGIPTLVLLRSPNEAIPSRVVRKSVGINREQEKVICRALKEYQDFYSYVASCDGIDIVRFETVVNAPRSFVEFVLCNIGLKVPEEFEIEPICRFARDTVEYWEEKHMSHDALTENFSNEKKEAKKAQVREKIEQRYPEMHGRVESLYYDLSRVAQL